MKSVFQSADPPILKYTRRGFDTSPERRNSKIIKSLGSDSMAIGSRTFRSTVGILGGIIGMTGGSTGGGKGPVPIITRIGADVAKVFRFCTARASSTWRPGVGDSQTA